MPLAHEAIENGAYQEQVKWIRARPSAGISTTQFHRSEEFRAGSYNNTREDVDNVVGHNLTLQKLF
jgi:hypothetical protein